MFYSDDPASDYEHYCEYCDKLNEEIEEDDGYDAYIDRQLEQDKETIEIIKSMQEDLKECLKERDVEDEII